MWVSWLDLASVLSEVVDILAEGFHILAGVFERLALHFGRDLVLIAGAGTTSEFEVSETPTSLRSTYSVGA